MLFNLKQKIFKGPQNVFDRIKDMFSKKSVIDASLYSELEDILIQSDIGFETTESIIKKLELNLKNKNISNVEDTYKVLKDIMAEMLIKETELKIEPNKLNVILVVGVNGVGKTTTIGKLAYNLSKEGKKVIIGASDTFRAAAIEQLDEWAKRANVEILKKEYKSDPGAVVYETLKLAKSKEMDVVIIDTAGRLHNKSDLMAELSKMNRIIQKELGEKTFYEKLLVIDSTTGQNGLNQAKIFDEIVDLTGFILTKLDGTAKGGIIFSISKIIKKPIKFIGIGEGIEDLKQFNPKEFINMIFE